jgi:hypothetical protein
MPAHRSLLLRLDVREALKLSHCKHNKKHDITKGELRLVVKEPGPGTPEYGYCMICAKEMVEQAETELAKLRAELG